MSNYKQEEEMSMEDILSSIRKYVADEKHGETFSSDENAVKPEQYQRDCANEVYNSPAGGNDDDVITLGQEDVADQSVGAKRVLDEDIVLGNPTTDTNYNNLNTEETSTKSYSKSVDRSESPFNKLAEALKTYGTRKKSTELSLKMSMEQFFRVVTESYLQKWMDANLKRAVDEIVRKEIEKLKQE